MNSSLLLLPEVQTEITRLWTSFPEGTHFLVKFRRVIRYYRRFCQLQATARNKTETDLRLRFSQLQADLQHNPCCLNTQVALAQCSKSLEKFEDTKLNGQRIRSRVRWRESGNACNKEFFQAVKSRHSKARITELAFSQGGSSSDLVEMRQICHDFYCELFSEPTGRVGTTQQMQEVLGDIPTKATVEMNAKLSAPIEKEELEQAMKALVNEKALGPDGSPSNSSRHIGNWYLMTTL
jgi:hypothetical protein